MAFASSSSSAYYSTAQAGPDALVFSTPPTSPPRTPAVIPAALPGGSTSTSNGPSVGQHQQQQHMGSGHASSSTNAAPTTSSLPGPSSTSPPALTIATTPPLVIGTKKRARNGIAANTNANAGPAGASSFTIKKKFMNDKEQRFNLRAAGSSTSKIHGTGKEREREEGRANTRGAQGRAAGSRPGTAESGSGAEGAAAGAGASGAVRFRRREGDDGDAYILVMGPSGAGKTSFINLASESNLPVSGGLKSCTSEVAVSEPFVVDGERVRLVDTPGFDDSTRSDADVLGVIAGFLAKEFNRGKRIRSILYFHRISDVRMGALSKKNFVMFQKLIGQHAFGNVVIVTTRWNEVNALVAESREAELRTKAAFFQPLVDAGAPMARYARTRECTERIIRLALANRPVDLSVQRQIVLERRSVAETDAGLKLQVEKMEGIAQCKDALQGLVQEIEVLKEANNMEGLRDLEKDIQELRDKVTELQEENQRLLSRENSEEWEMIDDEEVESPIPPLTPDSEDEDYPQMVGALPIGDSDWDGVGWVSWLLSFSSIFGLVLHSSG